MVNRVCKKNNLTLQIKNTYTHITKFHCKKTLSNPKLYDFQHEINKEYVFYHIFSIFSSIFIILKHIIIDKDNNNFIINNNF